MIAVKRLVDLRGIEPLSRNKSPSASTCLDDIAKV